MLPRVRCSNFSDSERRWGKDGVVFAVEKIVQSKLYESDANKRIFNVDRHVGVAVSGLVSANCHFMSLWL